MNREIKFRAWDKFDKRFGYIHVHPAGIQWPSPEWLDQSLSYDTHDNICGVQFGGIGSIMQYTGLKDKNGEEIYEGDIVKDQVNQFVWLYVIEAVNSFGNNLYAIPIWRNFTVIDGESIIGSYFESGSWSYISSTVEVIGNIYENSELLEAK